MTVNIDNVSSRDKLLDQNCTSDGGYYCTHLLKR